MEQEKETESKKVLDIVRDIDLESYSLTDSVKCPRG